MSGRDPLAEFLFHEADTPSREGDCGRFLARWFRARTGFRLDDDGPAFTGEPRHVYLKVWRRCRALGLAETDSPKRGDVAVVRAGNAVLAAICTGRGWASKTERGVLILNAGDHLRAWQVA